MDWVVKVVQKTNRVVIKNEETCIKHRKTCTLRINHSLLSNISLELCVKSCHTFGAMFYIGGSFGYFLSTSNCCNICM